MSVEQDDIQRRVIECIAVTMHLDPQSIRPDATFADLKIDSLDGINIVFALEEEFGIEVPEDAARETRTVLALLTGVKRLLDQKAQGV